MNRRPCAYAWIFALTLLCFASIGWSLPTATYSARLSTSALQPGQTSVAAIVFDVGSGLHVQSHTPSSDNLIKFELTPDPNPAVQFLDPIYPPPEVHDFPGLGQQSVYTGHVIIYLPMRISSTAPIGPTTISGKLTWQACNNQVCFRPERNKPFSIETKIVPASEMIAPVNAELFKGFDASIFAKGAPPVSSNVTSAVDTPAAVTAGTSIDFFGHSFSLGNSSIGLALLIALGVGVLFNLMPCVLPVVPLKAIGFFEVSRHNRAKCFFLGVVFSAGMLAFFALLSLLIVVFRTITWGQMFSHGWLIWPVVAVLALMAAGQFGLFDVVLPDRLTSVSLSHESIPGNFLFGAFTALLSTPCTAPMFAGLLAWSLAEPAGLGVTVMMTVGLGMALPYLLLSALPELTRWIPRSGAWSAVLKQTMGFLLLAVAVYFAGGRLASTHQFFWAVFGVIAAGMLFLVTRTAQLTHRLMPSAIALTFGTVVVWGTLAVTFRLTGGLDWQPYTPSALASARAAGKPVLVEFTANWCSNCMALEASVYHDPAAAAALHKRGVVLLRADLTSTDSQAPVWDVVNHLNPGGGIPLTAIYGAHATEPVKLTSLYTTRNLVDALDKAAG